MLFLIFFFKPFEIFLVITILILSLNLVLKLLFLCFIIITLDYLGEYIEACLYFYLHEVQSLMSPFHVPFMGIARRESSGTELIGIRTFIPLGLPHTVVLFH